LIGGFAALLVASFLPIWIIIYSNPIERLSEARSFWGIAFEIYESKQRIQDASFPVTTTVDLEENLTVAVTAFGAGCLLSAAIYAIKRRFRSTHRLSIIRHVIWIRIVLWISLIGVIFRFAIFDWP
jgi:hypothetical protein